MYARTRFKITLGYIVCSSIDRRFFNEQSYARYFELLSWMCGFVRRGLQAVLNAAAGLFYIIALQNPIKLCNLLKQYFVTVVKLKTLDTLHLRGWQNIDPFLPGRRGAGDKAPAK